MSFSRYRVAPIVALAMVCGLYLVLEARLWEFIVDDAFISFRYAENWAQGRGLVYNVGERTEGYTNFLYTALLGVAIKLGADPIVVAKILGLAGGICTLILTERLACLAFPSQPSWRLLPPLLLASNGTFVVQTADGLETSLSTALVLLCALLFLKEVRNPGRAALSGLAVAAASLTRPDNALLVPLFLALRPIAGGHPRPRKGECLRWMLSFLLLFAAVYVPYYAWRSWFYGYAFPNTFYAKSGGSYYLLRRAVRSLKLFADSLTLPVCVFAPLVLFSRGVRSWLVTCYGIILVKVGFQLWSGGAWMGRLRFLLPAMPFIYLLAAMGLRDTLQALSLAENKSRAAVAARYALVTIFVVVALSLNWVNLGPLYVEQDEYAAALVSSDIALGMRLQKEADRSAVLACQDAGALPFYSKLATIDLLGLNDTHIAHLRGSYLEKADADYVLARRPDYVVLNSWSATDESFDGTALLGRRLYADPRFKRTYRLAASYRVPLYWLWVFVRKGSPVEPVLTRWAKPVDVRR